MVLMRVGNGQKSGGATRGAVFRQVVDVDCFGRIQVEPFDSNSVDRRVGLQAADFVGVDSSLEMAEDRETRLKETGMYFVCVRKQIQSDLSAQVFDQVCHGCVQGEDVRKTLVQLLNASRKPEALGGLFKEGVPGYPSGLQLRAKRFQGRQYLPSRQSGMWGQPVHDLIVVKGDDDVSDVEKKGVWQGLAHGSKWASLDAP